MLKSQFNVPYIYIYIYRTVGYARKRVIDATDSMVQWTKCAIRTEMSHVLLIDCLALM